MFAMQRLSAFLGFMFFVGCASASDWTRTEVFDDGGRVEFNASGNPVRFTDISGQLFALNSSMLVEQVFDDGGRVEYNAAGNPVRFTDISGQLFVINP